MHGCGSGTALLVNAEVDSMGGVVDVGVGIGINTSPRRAAIEKAQAELRQEYDVREERRRELEFLEKGGDPLDFKFGNAASVSVQSTSLADHRTENIVTSEAKGSFARTASPHGDSVESSGRPGAPTVCEPNTADNFDDENELLEGERNSKHHGRRNNIAKSEQSSQMDGTQNAKESEDSAVVRPYARRNRSRPNRDGTRSSSTGAVQSSGGHGSSFPLRGTSKDVKGCASETKYQKDQMILSISNPKSMTLNSEMVSPVEIYNAQSNVELEANGDLPKGSLPDDRLDVAGSAMLRNNQLDQPSEVHCDKRPNDVASEVRDYNGGKEQVISGGAECPPSAVVTKIENDTCATQLNGYSNLKRDGNEGGTSLTGTKGLDSELTCIQNSLKLDVNNECDTCNNHINDDSNGLAWKRIVGFEGTSNVMAGEVGKENNEPKIIDNNTAINDNMNSIHQNVCGKDSEVKLEEDFQKSSDLQNEVKCPFTLQGVEENLNAISEAEKKVGNATGVDSNSKTDSFPVGPQCSMDLPVEEHPESTLSEKTSSAAPDPQSSSSGHLKLAEKAHEDSILEEAGIIEAKRKRIAELSVGTIPSESRRKSHWDFVLEEMRWLANDFAQERLWKMTAAAQICHRVAFTSRWKVEDQNQCWKLKKVAYNLAKAVMQFWHSAELLLNNNDQSKSCKYDSRRFDAKNTVEGKFGELNKETGKELELQNSKKGLARAIQGYAVRFLKHNTSPVPSLQAEAPATPDRIADSSIMRISWDDNQMEESLFYGIPSGAMETYRTSIESHLVHCEKTGSSVQEEVGTSIYDPATEFEYHENAYEEDEGETSTYYLHGAFEGSRSIKHDRRKRKNLMKSYPARPYKEGADLPYAQCTIGSQQNVIMGKRPANNLNVSSIPTKRLRTASRQRVISPFGSGVTGALQTPAKTDASSGDTGSFQDDQSTLHGGSQIQKSMEVESVGDFEKELPYDCTETSMKPKKKKAKNLVSADAQGWLMDPAVNNEQRDISKKRLDNHFDFNGTSGLYGQHTAKKPKIVKQPLDNAFDNMAPMTGSIPSPAASQMSNMSNTNRFMKLIGARDRGRKSKSMKMPTRQPGSGSPWSTFEDQALVVLVHDMGPNWELVSDAINSALQFKSVFRKPKECKDRHKILLDKGAGDGADSAEDSGSSQSYPSSLPGIPKGSARQLFQCLQGRREEDTIKSHFEKIIMIGKKLHFRSQNDNQDSKQMAPVHNSHAIALSQALPNNLNRTVLTPLDLCDATASSSDVISVGYQGPPSMSNQGAVTSILPTSGANPSQQGSSGMVLCNSVSSPSGPLNASVRDGRYNVPRTSLPVDEQQRMQQFNQMLSNRNLQQSGLPLSGTDRSVRMLPGGNGVGMMPGVNRNMPMARPGFQGIASSAMLNSGNMLSSGMVGMPSPVNMHSGTGTGQANSLMRPHEALHMMRPGNNPDHQRQMMVPELQMQGTQGNSQVISNFSGLSSSFANQTTPPPAQTYLGHPQQQHQMSPQQSHALSNPHLQGSNHSMGSQQQAYAMRLAKGRQMQQRLLQQPQQQQQFAASSALVTHVQPQPQIPMSSSIQSSSQIQPQTSVQPVSLPAVTSSSTTPVSVQQQQKHNLLHHGLSRNPQTGASGLTSQMGKPRQRQSQQQFQQSGRQHPQQRQHSQSLQQAKLLKGLGGGNTMMHQNLPIDHPHLNGLSVPPGNQVAEKGEQIMHLVQGQGLFSGAGLSSIQPSKPLVPPQSSNHSQPQQKLFSSSATPSSKHLQHMPSNSENSTQGQVQTVPPSYPLSASHQAIPTTIMASNHQHLQPQLQPKQVSQAQPASQRMLQHNHQMNPDLPSKSQSDQSHIDQHPVNNISQTGTITTTAMSQTCNGSANVISSAVAPPWRPEPFYDSTIPNQVSQAGSIGTLPPTNSAGNDHASTSQGVGQRQLSGGFQQHGHNTGGQWQQQPLVQQSTPPSQCQQMNQPQEEQQQQEQQSARQQLSLQQLTQQQVQLLPSAQGSLYIRPTNALPD